MLVKLSSTGQLVIPKEIRDALGLAEGAQLHLQVDGEKIILEPVSVAETIDALYGLFQGEDLLHDLEEEHRREIQEDATKP